MALLEICCYSLECAIAAERAGADRIELCAGPAEGGLTPSPGTLLRVRQSVTIPVHPIIRPRGGDFCYTADEFAVMLEDIAFVRDLGYPGLVTGVLNEDAEVDIPRMKKIIQAAQGMAVTFHRAFDMCANPFKAMDSLADIGVARILTSGQQLTALEGLSLLRELKAHSCAPIIMAGAGVRLSNLGAFIAGGVDELHSSAGMHVASPMRYRNAEVSMSSDARTDEYARYVVDGATVAAMKAMLTPAADFS